MSDICIIEKGFLEPIETKLPQNSSIKSEVHKYINPMAWVCPNCGQKIVMSWTVYNIHYDYHGYIESEANIVSSERHRIDEKYKYSDLMNQIDEEIRYYSEEKNEKCIKCGTSLKYEPGYYINECTNWNTKLISKIPKGYVQVVNHFTYIGYDNKEWVSKYEEDFTEVADWIIRAESSNKIYHHNKISKDFLSTIEKRNYNEDDHTGFVIKQVEFKDKLVRYYLSYDEVFALLGAYRKKYEETIISNHSETILRETLQNNVIENKVIDSANLSVSELKDYLNKIIGIETAIQSVINRLPRLYYEYDEEKRLKNRQQLCLEELDIISKYKSDISVQKKELELTEQNKDNWEGYYREILDGMGTITFPSKPIEPQAPVYEQPGLFNKRKVEAENEEKRRLYQENYNNYLKVYAQYESCIAQLTEQQRQNEETAKREAIEKCNNYYLEKKESVSRKIKGLEEQLALEEDGIREKRESLSASYVGLVENELLEAEKMLSRLYLARKQYEDCNVIYGKYRDLVAYTSFYEYLECGRCTTLSGPEGAYNLYESESRQNIIISKLSDVLISLEEIKHNQFMIYSKLDEMNKQLYSLNFKMDSALSEIGKIRETTSDIRTYSEKIKDNTAVIAYNTEVTAYYSKMNAELTNALGFLIALQ